MKGHILTVATILYIGIWGWLTWQIAEVSKTWIGTLFLSAVFGYVTYRVWLGTAYQLFGDKRKR